MEGEMRNDVSVKRRKVDGEGNVEGEEIEEKKVEMFYALIRSTREARERLKRVIISSDGHKEKSNIEIVEDGGPRLHRDTRPPIWTPKFEWEDFMMGTSERFNCIVNRVGSSGTHHHRLASSRGGAGRGGGDQANGKEDVKGLDLRLSL